MGDPFVFLGVFIRKKKNKSGSFSVQVLEKRNGKNHLVKTIGSSSNASEIAEYQQVARGFIVKTKGQLTLALQLEEEESWFQDIFDSIQEIKLVGPELVLGPLYDQIGFNQIEDELLRHLVLTRLIYPASKLKTVRLLREYTGIDYSVDQVYRYLDKLHKTQKERVQTISYEHTLKVLGGQLYSVFYDVTTLYFETDREDALRISGFSKDGKHKHPQILLGLLVSENGYPLAYDIFEGNKYEGSTLLPVLEGFKKRYKIEDLTVVADSGLLTQNNVDNLASSNYSYILGARIKNEKRDIKQQIIAREYRDGDIEVIERNDGSRLIISYSEKRAKKDAHNRKKGIERLEKKVKSNKLSKKHINNRGYNKYLKLTGEVAITIDYTKFEADQKWDGLKGYLTNTTLEPKAILANYSELWKIEKAFRVSKTDLKVRPIYHRLRRRIEAHLCIAFMSYKLYKELERQLKQSKDSMSVNRVIELIQQIKAITVRHPKTLASKTKIILQSQEQRDLLEKFNIKID